MSRKKKYGNPKKEKAYRDSLKKAKNSKVLDPKPDFFIGNPNEVEKIGLNINGIEVVTRCNEDVGQGIDTSMKYSHTFRDILGEYEFVMSNAGKGKVFVTVEGTPYKNYKMDKRQAFWEWDMLWNKHGVPKILQEVA